MNIIPTELLEALDGLSVEEKTGTIQMFRTQIDPSFITADDCKSILIKSKPNDFDRPYYRAHERW